MDVRGACQSLHPVTVQQLMRNVESPNFNFDLTISYLAQLGFLLTSNHAQEDFAIGQEQKNVSVISRFTVSSSIKRSLNIKVRTVIKIIPLHFKDSSYTVSSPFTEYLLQHLSRWGTKKYFLKAFLMLVQYLPHVLLLIGIYNVIWMS